MNCNEIKVFEWFDLFFFLIAATIVIITGFVNVSVLKAEIDLHYTNVQKFWVTKILYMFLK